MPGEFGSDLVGRISYDCVAANRHFGLQREVADEMQREIVVSDQIGADDGMAAIAQRVRNGTTPCTRFPNPMRQILDGEQLLDGDRRCLIKVMSDRGRFFSGAEFGDHAPLLALATRSLMLLA